MELLFALIDRELDAVTRGRADQRRVLRTQASVSVRITTLLDRYEGRLALALVLLYAVVFGSLALVRHWALHSTALDLGVFDQVLWNTVHGRFMESTLSLERCDPHSFFLDHFSPALLVIVPFYAIVPRPETLIFVQTVALALGTWPIYLLARRVLERSE